MQMGGIGSGRHCRFDAASTTEDYRSIDVRRWKRDGLLKPGCRFNWQWTRDGEVRASIHVTSKQDKVVLTYKARSGVEDWRDHSYPVLLATTPCHLGGQRHWFRCPAKGCGRRVAILYGGHVFACRRCYRLTYASQRELLMERAARQADKIRERLGWEPGILNLEGEKPKGMHHKTFERLRAEHDAYVDISLTAASQHFGLRL